MSNPSYEECMERIEAFIASRTPKAPDPAKHPLGVEVHVRPVLGEPQFVIDEPASIDVYDYTPKMLWVRMLTLPGTEHLL